MVDLVHLLPRLLTANPELAVNLAWARVAGAGIRRHAVPHRLEGETFIISVADAVWQKQLQSMSAELIFRMNTLLKQRTVKEIIFRINPAAVSQSQPTTQPPANVEREPAPTELLFAAASINDPDLRARFIRAAENCIARRNAQARS